MDSSDMTAFGADMRRWAGRVALVTGASSGIGRAIADALAGVGMRVAAVARREERLEVLAARWPEGRVRPLRLDLRDPEAIVATFDAVRAAWGGVDVLINASGVGREAPLMAGATEDWRLMLDVNVLALCVATREAVRDMRGRGDDGHVIHISSMSGHRVPGPSGVYAASKHAVRALTEGLRRELRAAGSGVRVSSVSPGFVETEFHAGYYDSAERAAETYARLDCLRPEDIARAVVHVLAQPPRVQIHDVLVRPTQQES